MVSAFEFFDKLLCSWTLLLVVFDVLIFKVLFGCQAIFLILDFLFFPSVFAELIFGLCCGSSEFLWNKQDNIFDLNLCI